jgi:hypothetical protein
MSLKLGLVSMLTGVLLVNGFAVSQSFAKETKKKDDKKSVVTVPADFQFVAEHKKKDDKKQELAANQRTEGKKKKDDEKKLELIAADGQSALMKPASWRHFQQQQQQRQHCSTNA